MASLVILHTYPPMKMEQSVPKRRNIKFWRRGITQKKAYNRIILSDEFDGMWKEAVDALNRDKVGYCDICLEWLRKATKNFSQDSRSPVRGRNVEFPEYEGVLLPQRLQRWYSSR